MRPWHGRRAAAIRVRIARGSLAGAQVWWCCSAPPSTTAPGGCSSSSANRPQRSSNYHSRDLPARPRPGRCRSRRVRRGGLPPHLDAWGDATVPEWEPIATRVAAGREGILGARRWTRAWRRSLPKGPHFGEGRWMLDRQRAQARVRFVSASLARAHRSREPGALAVPGAGAGGDRAFFRVPWCRFRSFTISISTYADPPTRSGGAEN